MMTLLIKTLVLAVILDKFLGVVTTKWKSRMQQAAVKVSQRNQRRHY